MRLIYIIGCAFGRRTTLVVALLMAYIAAAGREARAINVVPEPTHVYWTENSRPFGGARLRRIPVGGGMAVELFADDDLYVRDMQIDSIAQKLYWVAYEDGLVKIQRRNLDGSGPVDLYTHSETPLHFIDVLALDPSAGKVYWTETDVNSATYLIRRANLDGSGLQDVRATVGRPGDLMLDLPRGQMFWQDFPPAGGNAALRRANLDGNGYQTLVDPMGIFNMEIDSANSRMYMTYYGGDWVMRSGLDGVYSVIYRESNGVGNGPLDLEIDPLGQNLYWVNEIDGSIQRARVSPFNPTPVTLITGLNNPTVIALGVIPEPGCLVLAAVATAIAGATIRRRRG